MRKQRESGWALLFVFVLAASIAIMLYMELPRVAFESQRAKEQMLIDRGEQYSLAIRRFVTKTGKYPAKMEDLEDWQGRHFLRHRYKDPMTGKDDWRIIHMGPMGQLTDSKLTPPPASPTGQTPGQQTASNSGFGAALTTGSTTSSAVSSTTASADTQPAMNMAAIRRPSDRGTAPVAGGPEGEPGADSNQDVNQEPNQQDPNQQPPFDAQNQGGVNPPRTPPQPGQINPQTGQPYPPAGVPGQRPFPPNPNQPGGNPPLPNGQAGQIFSPVQTGQGGQIYPAQGSTGVTAGGGSGPANPSVPSAVTNQIFGARPQPQQGSFSPGNTPLGATGIAGVASTFNAEGIMRYKDHEKYTEWEFVFTPNSGLGQQNGQQNQNQQNQNPQNSFPQNQPQQNSP